MKVNGIALSASASVFTEIAAEPNCGVEPELTGVIYLLAGIEPVGGSTSIGG